MAGALPTFPGSSSGYPPLAPGGFGSVAGPPPPMFYSGMGNPLHPSMMGPQTAPHMVAARGEERGDVGGRFGTMEYTTEAREKIVEVPEIQVVEKIVEVPQKVIQEKIVHVPRVETVERKIQVPKTVYKEKIVEVPQIQYREVVTERVVEVPEVQTQVVTKEVDVPVHVDVPVVQPRKSPVEQLIERNIPMPVELRVSQGYEIPKLKPKYKEVPVPIYVPRYIEVPVPAQFVNALQGNSAMASPQNTASRMVTSNSMGGPTQGPLLQTMQGPASPPSRRPSTPMVIPIQSRMPTGQATPMQPMSRRVTGNTPLVVNYG